MNGIAASSAADRRDLFNEVAARRNLSPVIIEKDFWVCWTLLQLFRIGELRDQIVFKGGTSLSKVYHAIGRFSEDIDLSISEEFLGIEPIGQTPLSKNQRDKRFGRIRMACERAVGGTVLPLLKQRFGEIIGGSSHALVWSIEQASDDPATLIFYYPPAVAGTLAYIMPAVRLEMGSGVDPWPTDWHKIRPISAEVFPDLFDHPEAEVVCLGIARTFWEKATILHMVNTRTKPQYHRLSRHFSDVASMRNHPDLRELSAHFDLLQRAAQHKADYFPTSGVEYADCFMGKLVLVPPVDRLQAIRADYEQMREMFFGEVMSFDKIIQTLAEIELAVNDSSARP